MKRAPITCGGTQAKVCSRCASAFAGWSQRDAPTRTMRTSSFAGSGDCDVRSRDFLLRPCSAPCYFGRFSGLARCLQIPASPRPHLQGFTGPTFGAWQAANPGKSQCAVPLLRSPLHPDLNPIEMLFHPLKTLLRKAAERMLEGLHRCVGSYIRALDPSECKGYFRHSGYEPL
jgi:hypothetical protein